MEIFPLRAHGGSNICEKSQLNQELSVCVTGGSRLYRPVSQLRHPAEFICFLWVTLTTHKLYQTSCIASICHSTGCHRHFLGSSLTEGPNGCYFSRSAMQKRYKFLPLALPSKTQLTWESKWDHE